MHNCKQKTSIKHAFFDVDDTLISQKSMLNFINLYFRKIDKEPLKLQFDSDIKYLLMNDVDWKIANTVYYSYFQHFIITEVKKTIDLWFNSSLTKEKKFYNKSIVKVLKKHQSEGTVCVFVSGSFRELLQPIADDLGVEHILSINLERAGEKYTGNIIPPQTIGDGKADAIRLFLDAHGGNAEDCYAYGDDISDVPMLEAVGNPRAVAGGRRLEAYAKDKGWPILRPD
jgi:HAD superfamily hydrolase (TIGR01490 family)